MQNKIGIGLIFALIVWILLLQIVFLVEAINPYIYLTYGETTRYLGIIYLAAMYIICAILIWTEIKDLKEFHIDKFVIVTFILSSLFRPNLDIAGGIYFWVLIGMVGVSVGVALVIRKPKLLQTDIRWTLIATLVGGLVVAVITFAELSLRQSWALAPLLQNNIILTVSNLIVRELFASVLLEEILFRGFLWGYLKKLGWKDRKIFWTQGILFWITHFGRIFTPFTFFVIIPVITLISSKLALRTKQVFPAIISHMVINILSAMLNLATY